MFPTTTMLNLSPSDKDKDVASSLVPAAVLPSMMNTAQEAVEDVLPQVMLVAHATRILRLTDSDITTLARTIIAKMPMLKTTPDFPTLKSTEEVLEVHASLVLLVAPAHQLHLLVSASSILALALDQALNSQSKLVPSQFSVKEKERCQLVDTKAQLTALIL